MTDKTLKDMEIWADEAVSYCFHVGHTTPDTKMADYLNAAVKELKRHGETIKVYQEYIRTQTEYLDKCGRGAKEALKRGDEILKGEKG